MSINFEMVALVVGRADDTFSLHKEILKLESLSPSSRFSYEGIFVGVADVYCMLFRSRKSRYRPQFEEVLMCQSSPDLAKLDLCSYVVAIGEADVTTVCYHCGELIAQNTPIDTDTDITLGHFESRCAAYGIDHQLFEDCILPKLQPSRD